MDIEILYMAFDICFFNGICIYVNKIGIPEDIGGVLSYTVATLPFKQKSRARNKAQLSFQLMYVN